MSLLSRFRSYSRETGKVVLVMAGSCPHCRELMRGARLRGALTGEHTVVLNIDNDRDRSIAYALFTGVSVEEHLMWAQGARKSVKTPMVVVMRPNRVEGFLLDESDNPVLNAFVSSRVKGVVYAEKVRGKKGERE